MISFICSAYNRPNNLKLLAYSLICQTCADWELLVMDESEERINDITSLDKRIRFFPCDRFNDWGYSVKNQGIGEARGEFLCFPADDAYYAPPFVTMMTSILRDNDIAYCNWIHDRHEYQPVSVAPLVGLIDVGGFVIRKNKMTLFDKHQLADGMLIQDLATKCNHAGTKQYLYVKN